MIRSDNDAVSGQIVVNPVADDGSGNLRLSNAAASSSYTLQFCPFPSAQPEASGNRCFTVTTFTTDSMGSATADFTFPKSGTWAGIFAATRNNATEFVSAFNIPGSGKQYRSTMKDAGSLNSNNGSFSPGGDGLRHGSVTVTDSMAHVELQNAIVSVTYNVIYCRNGGGSSCYSIGNLSTDATGSGSTDINLQSALGTSTDAGIFRLDRTYTIVNGTQQTSVEFVTSFVSGCAQVRCE